MFGIRGKIIFQRSPYHFSFESFICYVCLRMHDSYSTGQVSVLKKFNKRFIGLHESNIFYLFKQRILPSCNRKIRLRSATCVGCIGFSIEFRI